MHGHKDGCRRKPLKIVRAPKVREHGNPTARAWVRADLGRNRIENSGGKDYELSTTYGHDCPGGHGPSDCGFDTRSESPTNPTAPLWRVSTSNLRGDADFLTTKLRILRRIERGAQEVRLWALTQALIKG